MELLKNINFIFQEEVIYNIPEYQRGYKWTRKNVEELFRDIYNFRDNNENSFYCLQNLTLVKVNDKQYNVVDGQQRLTTITLIMHYMKEPIKATLKYSIRESTQKFIEDYIVTGKIWAEKPPIKHLDQHYLYEVAEEIKQQYNKLSDDMRVDFRKTFINRVKLIYNVVKDNEEDIFANINGVKVSLDGADLMRGLLMTRAAKEKFSNSPDGHNVSEFRVKMGMELDAINIWFGDKIHYFTQLLEDKNRKNDQFVITNKPINLLYSLYYEIKADDTSNLDYRFFEYGFDSNGNNKDNRWEMFQELKNLYSTLVTWHNDTKIYNYIGYLFFNFKTKCTFKSFYNNWKMSSSKEEFMKFLAGEIKRNILTVFSGDNKEDECTIEDLLQYVKSSDYDWYNESHISKILILLDIDTDMRIGQKYFVVNDEDKEHILPQTPRADLCSFKSGWKQVAQFHSIEIRNAIDECLSECDEELANTKIDELNKIIADNTSSINSIGNIVLLHKSINRGYGNANFIHKVNRVVTEYLGGKYIVRPHTLGCFSKTFVRINRDGKQNEDKVDLSTWTEEDIKKNAANIGCKIETVLNRS